MGRSDPTHYAGWRTGVSPRLGRGFLDDALDAAVGVFRESARVSSVDGRVLRPRPPAELRAPVVVEGLLQFRARVHDERAVLRDRLADRTTLQQQNLDRAIDGLRS